ncbi:MAG TPA: LPS export ABC transporter periplasmic protein LptC [Steroidobacteraceae bacterium]|nr:LPS export ABC transporter periplasmic protein LptC [Steroidobacteraceae bacterium]
MSARLLLFAAAAALFAVIVQWRLLGREAPAPAEMPVRPGYYLTGVDLEEFGHDGRLRVGLQSARADEDAMSGIVRLSDVAVNYHSPTGQFWVLTADQARVPQGGRMVEFEGGVLLAGMPAGGVATAELRTARMLLDTDAELAQTKSEVELAFGRHRITAQGMRADLKAGSLRLESDVHGLFTP